MRGIKEFLTEKRREMMAYIQVVSTPTDPYGSKVGMASDRHDRLNVVNALRQRASAMPVLDREAIPILPHLLDIPRHLAIITSAVIRSSREFHSKSNATRDPADKALLEFCSRCFEVEEQALLRVSQLATKISSGHRRTSTSGNWTQVTSTVTSPTSAYKRIPTSPISPGHGDRRRPRQATRPSTAPSPSEANPSRQGTSYDFPTTPARLFAKNPGDCRARTPHLKSPSTDSVPLSQPSTHPRQPEATTDVSDDAGKRKRGLLRGILRR